MTTNNILSDLAYAREMQEAASAHAVRALLGAIDLMPCETCERVETCDGTGCNKRSK